MLINVVQNIKPESVTWEGTFLSAAKTEGIEVSATAKDNRINLFMGDAIDRRRIGKSVYFLAALSAPPGEPDSLLLKNEIANMQWVDLIVVPSQAEYNRAEIYWPKKIIVGGFPIIQPHMQEKKVERLVCFIADDRPIKNLDFEEMLLPAINAGGFQIMHLSPTKLHRRAALEKLGAVVFEELSREDYFRMVSQASHYVSTSKYESLSIAGIEAALMGCACITPDVGGFKDWCPNRYTEYTIPAVLKQFEAPLPSKNLDFYSPRQFFSRIGTQVMNA